MTKKYWFEEPIVLTEEQAEFLCDLLEKREKGELPPIKPIENFDYNEEKVKKLLDDSSDN